MAGWRRGIKDWFKVAASPLCRKPFPFPTFSVRSIEAEPPLGAAPSRFLRAKAWVTITIQITRQLVTCACLTALINERKTANFASGAQFYFLSLSLFFPSSLLLLLCQWREKERERERERKRARVSRDPAAFVSTRPHSFMLVCKRRRLPLRGCRGLLGRYSVTRS